MDTYQWLVYNEVEISSIVPIFDVHKGVQILVEVTPMSLTSPFNTKVIYVLYKRASYILYQTCPFEKYKISDFNIQQDLWVTTAMLL